MADTLAGCPAHFGSKKDPQCSCSSCLNRQSAYDPEMTATTGTARNQSLNRGSSCAAPGCACFSRSVVSELRTMTGMLAVSCSPSRHFYACMHARPVCCDLDLLVHMLGECFLTPRTQTLQIGPQHLDLAQVVGKHAAVLGQLQKELALHLAQVLLCCRQQVYPVRLHRLTRQNKSALRAHASTRFPSPPLQSLLRFLQLTQMQVKQEFQNLT